MKDKDDSVSVSGSETVDGLTHKKDPVYQRMEEENFQKHPYIPPQLDDDKAVNEYFKLKRKC